MMHVTHLRMRRFFFSRVRCTGGDVPGTATDRIERSETNASPIERRPCQKSPSPAGGEKGEKKKEPLDQAFSLSPECETTTTRSPPPLPPLAAAAAAYRHCHRHRHHSTIAVANVKNVK